MMNVKELLEALNSREYCIEIDDRELIKDLAEYKDRNYDYYIDGAEDLVITAIMEEYAVDAKTAVEAWQNWEEWDRFVDGFQTEKGFLFDYDEIREDLDYEEAEEERYLYGNRYLW